MNEARSAPGHRPASPPFPAREQERPLKGDRASGAQFTGSPCGLCATEWVVQRKNL
ncbi:hypothetical protein [Saccharothrix longispora]|uniref:hypothetical protein n=1 Tax=Saccharothrix longispora TaxID=33920 RepID=UPI0028FD9265|nr:hypothetical protein [Saccharothrix longispora]MDU0288579.1 hypothetical protein [Saccharothrix longispora]